MRPTSNDVVERAPVKARRRFAVMFAAGAATTFTNRFSNAR